MMTRPAGIPSAVHCRQYLAIVISSLMPFICMAPSPTSAITVRSGKANLAAMAYGTPGPMLARPPDRLAFMPLRNLISRAYQFAAEPESQVRMALSGRRGDSSQNTRCGLTGLASFMARASITRHQRATFSSISVCQPRSVLRSSKGISARKVARASPTRLHSIG